MDANEEAKIRLDEEYKQMGAQLEQHCVPLLQKLIRCMKGEEVDHTGLGMWRIFCDSLESAMKCRVITEEQWQGFVELQEKVYGKQG